MADVVLGGGRKDRPGQPVGLAQARGQRDAADAAGLLVVLPAGAGEIAADDTLDGKHAGSPDDHASAGELGKIRVKGSGKAGGVGGEDVVGGEVTEQVEPEERELGEDPALVGDAAAEDVIEGGDAVGGDEEQVGLGRRSERIDVADLAAGEQGKSAEMGLEESVGHDAPSIADR